MSQLEQLGTLCSVILGFSQVVGLSGGCCLLQGAGRDGSLMRGEGKPGSVQISIRIQLELVSVS